MTNKVSFTVFAVGKHKLRSLKESSTQLKQTCLIPFINTIRDSAMVLSLSVLNETRIRTIKSVLVRKVGTNNKINLII